MIKGPIRISCLICFLMCLQWASNVVPASAGDIPNSLRVKKTVHIDGKQYAVVAYSPSTNGDSTAIGFLFLNGGKTQHVEITHFDNTDKYPVAVDVCVSRSAKCVYVLNGRQVAGTIAEYFLSVYSLNPKTLQTRRFKSQIQETKETNNGIDRTRIRSTPLNIRAFLASKLDPDSPMRDPKLLPVHVSVIKNVQMQNGQDGSVKVIGDIGRKWSFVITLKADEDTEVLEQSEQQLSIQMK